MIGIDADTLWTSLPVPAMLIDPADCIAQVNIAAEQFLNTSSRSLTGAPVFERLLIDMPLDQALERVRRDRGPFFINRVDVGTRATPPVACNIQVAPLSGSEGLILLLIQPRQVTERLGQVKGANTAIRSAIGMAEMLAHEIKNPLAGITGAAQLVAMNLTPADREMTDLIVAESRRIVALLDQVEQFGNLRPPSRHAVNVHDLLDRALRSARVGFGAHMAFVEDFDPSLPPIFVDGDQMLQVFLNLLSNAAEAGKEGGTITLRTFYDSSLRLRRKDGTGSDLPLQVEVIDDGPGIAADLVEQIFEPFVSGRENGTGLGLALVSKIIADHDCWIALKSEPGRTIFRLSLPVAPASEEIR